MWEENHARLDYVTWIIHPVLDDLHSSLNIGAWQDKKSGRYFWLGPLLFTLIFRLFSVYLLCCQHYSHICSCLFMSFHLLTKPYYVTIKGGDWLPGLPGGSPAAWWRRCHRRPWRPPPQLPRCGRNGRCRRRCWRRWTSPCLSESKCVCVCVRVFRIFPQPGFLWFGVRGWTAPASAPILHPTWVSDVWVSHDDPWLSLASNHFRDDREISSCWIPS